MYIIYTENCWKAESSPQRASVWDKLAVSSFCNSWQKLRNRLHKRFLGMV